MKRFSWRKPYMLLLLPVLVLCIDGIAHPKPTIDIHRHDTYYVIYANHLKFVIALFFIFFIGIYYSRDKILPYSGFTWFHIATTLLCVSFWYSYGFWVPAAPIGADPFYNFVAYQRLNTIGMVITLISVFGQLAFVLNNLAAIIKQLNKPNSPIPQDL